MTLWIVRRGNTLYCYLVIRNLGLLGNQSTKDESLKKFFSLMD